jgi:rSAM/selenodomain-associated transferase 2/rSAM/selenodomain-associated transferase 1
VKTRLAESLGTEQAARLYREWIGAVLQRVQPLRGDVQIVAYFDGAPRPAFADWEHLADDWWPQPDGDLGARLTAGFERACVQAAPVIAIGTDCLELDAAAIREAFARLADHEAVFGPTRDGGYYLVGTARHLPGFFQEVPWSSADTLSAQVSQCNRHGWSVSLLATRRDIDTAEDWRAYCAASRCKPQMMAVVIPTLNEEKTLPAALQSVLLQGDGDVQIVVADGGSTDATREIADRFGATVILSARRGRGCQIAAAMGAVTGDVVLVLHADARLPPGALDRIRDHLAAQPGCPGGCLGHRFDSRRAAYRVLEAMDALRARWGVSYGDQGQFFRCSALERQGGFPDQPIMEDVELSRRLWALGRPAYLDCQIFASPRRLELLGLWRSMATNFLLRTVYRIGGVAMSERIYRWYYRRADKLPLPLPTTTEART